MGKISDALEKSKKEKVIRVENFPEKRPEDKTTAEIMSLPSRESMVQNRYDPKLVVISAPGSLETENFKKLRTQILFPKDGHNKKVIMVTSVFPKEGKTFVAANLAASIALGIHEHVLLVDCDFRMPYLHKMLGYSNREGLHEYLTGRKDLKDLLIHTSIDTLSLLPAGSASMNPAELLASVEMKQFLIEVRERYDDCFIIVDATPLQITSDASVLSNYVDGILFVVMAGKTPREAIQKNIAKLHREKIVGMVFNGYAQDFKRYGRYYNKLYKDKE